MDTFLALTTALFTGCFLFLLVQGVRLGLIRHYPLAYAFLTCKFAAFWIKTVAIASLGVSHPKYVSVYFGTTISVDLFALVILLQLYYLPYPPSLRRDWPLLALFPMFIALSLTEPMHPFYRTSYVIFFYLTSVGALAAARLFFRGRMRIGANLRGLLYGICVPAALQAFNQALRYLGVTIWSYDAFRVVNELTTTISWGIIAYGMRCYDPPRTMEDSSRLDSGEAVRRLQGLRKALRRLP